MDSKYFKKVVLELAKSLLDQALLGSTKTSTNGKIIGPNAALNVNFPPIIIESNLLLSVRMLLGLQLEAKERERGFVQISDGSAFKLDWSYSYSAALAGLLLPVSWCCCCFLASSSRLVPCAKASTIGESFSC